jgi:hypothetical protein
LAIAMAFSLACGGRSSDETTTPRAAAASAKPAPAPSTAQTPDARQIAPSTSANEAVAEVRVTQAMIAFKGLADEMCACLSPDCATGVETKIEALGERFSDLDSTDFTEIQQQELMLAAIRMAQCQAQLLAQRQGP